MKLLLSAYACEPNRGSEPGGGWNWASSLAQAGHEVWVLTRPRGREAIEAQLRATPIPNLHFAYVEVSRVLQPFLRGQVGVYLHYLAWQRAAHPVARQLEQAHDFDFVHHVSFGTLLGGSQLWRLQKPFVFGPIGGGQVAPPAFKSYFGRYWRQEAARSFVIERLLPLSLQSRRMLRHTALLLATNEDTLVRAQQMGAREARYFLDCGLPRHFFSDAARPRRTGETLKILWVGRLYPRKAVRLALEAVSRLQIPFRLTVLGDGPLGPDVPGWLAELQLEEQVDWRGQVPWAEVQEAYQSHDVFLFTSLRDSFGSQLLEAMANGLPLVTLGLHGVRDLTPDTVGIKVPVSTPAETVEGVAQALEKMYHRPDGRRTMAAAAYAYAESQEWSNRAAAMTALDRAVLREGGPSAVDAAHHAAAT